MNSNIKLRTIESLTDRISKCESMVRLLEKELTDFKKDSRKRRGRTVPISIPFARVPPAKRSDTWPFEVVPSNALIRLTVPVAKITALYRYEIKKIKAEIADLKEKIKTEVQSL